MIRPFFICLLVALLAGAASADETAASIALLVNEANADVIVTRVGAALTAKDNVIREAAARVALVRGLTSVVPQIRDALAAERDPDAAREEVRALIVLGDAGDVDRAREATRWLPPTIDDVIAGAVARRADAFDIYVTTLRAHGFKPDSNFFTQALWVRPAAAVAAASRLLGMRDADGWRALLGAVGDSHLAMQAGVLSASLNSPIEEIRTASVWYLVHSYLPDPSMIHESVRAALAAPTEEASMREAFGRELLRRMMGGERKDDARWPEWLQSAEADPLVGNDESIFEYFTDNEFLVRKKHCGISSFYCKMPDVRRTTSTIRSAAVAAPAFFLPDLLPPGVAGAVIAGARCDGSWLALAGASSDRAGRVQNITMKRVEMDGACEKAVSALMRLSLVDAGSINTPLSTGNILLVHSRNQSPCLDEGSLAVPSASPRRVGGEVTAPIVKRRVEPHFPESARRAMGHSVNVFVIVSSVISREGCVRSIQLISQSPYPELNRAALQALSQWTFVPGRVRGEPADVIFYLTVNFKID
jgi:TonB family protein